MKNKKKKYKKYKIDNGFNRYAAIRTELSRWLKENKRQPGKDFKQSSIERRTVQRTFQKLNNDIYNRAKRKLLTLKQIYEQIGDLIEYEFQDIDICRWHDLEHAGLTQYSDEQQIIVDSRHLVSEDFYFKGTKGEFFDNYASEFWAGINEKYQRSNDHYLYYALEKKIDHKGEIYYYCLLADDADMEAHTRIEDILSREELSYEDLFDAPEAKPTIPGVPPPAKPEAEPAAPAAPPEKPERLTKKEIASIRKKAITEKEKTKRIKIKAQEKTKAFQAELKSLDKLLLKKAITFKQYTKSVTEIRKIYKIL